MHFFTCAALLILLASCGQQREEAPQPESKRTTKSATPYGSAAEVTEYLQAIAPYVSEMSRVQQEVDQYIGSTSKATGANLAPVMERVRPRLQKTLDEFEKIEPPPLLAPFHDKVKKLMVMGLDAYGTTIEGWKLEREKKDLSLYKKAETLMARAKTLSGELNQEMQRIHLALREAAAPPSSP